MEDKVKKLIKPGLWIALIVVVIASIFNPPQGVKDYVSILGYCVIADSIALSLYVKWLWRLNPKEKLPRLKKHYTGIIKYNFNNIDREKEVKINIKQTLFSVKVKSITNSNRSTTLTGDIILEGDEYYLYYTYITYPESKELRNNPIQHGTCRILLDDETYLRGNYWTSSQTIGDIILSNQ